MKIDMSKKAIKMVNKDEVLQILSDLYMEYIKSKDFNIADGIMVAMGNIEEMKTMYSFTEEEHEKEVNRMYANNDLRME